MPKQPCVPQLVLLGIWLALSLGGWNATHEWGQLESLTIVERGDEDKLAAAVYTKII